MAKVLEPHCDLLLVTDDMLGLYDSFTPKFVRKFTNLQDETSGAAECYCAAVIHGIFPAKDHLFFNKKDLASSKAAK